MSQLLGQVEKGLVSEQALLKLLRAVQQGAPSFSPPSWLSQLEETSEKNTQEPDGPQAASQAAEILCEQTRHLIQMTNDGADEVVFAFTAESEVENGGGKSELEPERSNADEPEVKEEDEHSSSSKSYCCRWCKKNFAYKCRVVAHMKRCPMSKECQLECPQCPSKLPSKRALQRHLTEAHPSHAGDKKKKKVACDLCGRTFAHPSGEGLLLRQIRNGVCYSFASPRASPEQFRWVDSLLLESEI